MFPFVRGSLLGVRDVIDYDFELRAHNERLRAAVAVESGQRVLDIGCGAGQTTRDAARAAAPGHVLGVDLSVPLLERARALAAAERLGNVTFEHGDAQVHPFARGHFDLAISRFGTMFFSDPLVAFGNIAGALRPRARMVLLVWQSHRRNEWAMAIDGALPGSMPASGAGPFSLGDRAATAGVLERAGFNAIHFADVREPVFYGRDSDAAMEFVGQFETTRDALSRLSPTESARALERLRETLEDHRTADAGVAFDSRAWLITAHR